MKKFNWLNFLTALSMIFCFVALSLYGIASLNKNIPYVECSCDNRFEIDSCINTYSKTETKIKLDALFGNPLYFYKETEFNSIVNGCAQIFIRTITIEAKLDEITYTFTLAHELVHLTYFTFSDRFANYQAFVKLYESGDEYFVEMAKLYANIELSGNTGQPERYKCGWYIKEYLCW
jgi:hypothetical protein